jgi:ATP-binding cassette subfamily B protein
VASQSSNTNSFAAFSRLLRYARGYCRRIIAATTGSTINKLFEIAPETLIGIAPDMVVNQEDSGVCEGSWNPSLRGL